MLINIHTHRKPNISNEYVVRNAFGIKLKSNKPLGYSVSTGIHPWQVKQDNSEAFKNIEANLHLTNVIAIGECGLDRVRGPEMKIQTEILIRHVELANKFNKPLILHLVKTYSDIVSYASGLKTPWIIHGFKGNLNEATTLISKGARLSFGPRLTFSPELQNIFKSLPIEHIYLETDTKPMHINEMYEFTCKLLRIPLEQLKDSIKLNFERDFSVVLPIV